MTKDYYEILGVTEFESAENIKLAYRKLARKWHPDVAGNSEDIMAKFKEINEAYEILSNLTKKNEYDKARKFYNYAKQNTTYKTQDTVKQTTNPQNRDKNSYFDWNSFIKKRNHQEEIKSPIKGQDLHTEIEISVFEAFNGVNKIINILETEVCPKCKGKKFINGSTCHNCNDKGELNTYKKFNVKIPAGIKNNSKIRLSGEGYKGKFGGKDGDLYITIKIKDNNYNINGNDILKTIPISPFEAVLGANIKLSTLNGNINLKIAPNTQNGQKIRLTGCGMVQNNQIGDMIITIEIRIPKKLSSEELALYRKLEQISSENIRDNVI